MTVAKAKKRHFEGVTKITAESRGKPDKEYGRAVSVNCNFTMEEVEVC